MTDEAKSGVEAGMTVSELAHIAHVNRNNIGHYTGFKFVYALEKHFREVLSVPAASLAAVEDAVQWAKYLLKRLENDELGIGEIDAMLRRVVALAAPTASPAADEIERDPDDHSREYIPLPGGWEVQTKGAGSSYRLLDKKTGERHLILTGKDWKPLQDFFTRFARELFEACRAHPASPSPAPAAGEGDFSPIEQSALRIAGLVDDNEDATRVYAEALTALSRLAADNARIVAERDSICEKAVEKTLALDAAEAERDEVRRDFAIVDGLRRAAEACASALEGALKQIASQKTVNELCAEFGKEYETDWEGGYDQCIATARAALSPTKETP